MLQTTGKNLDIGKKNTLIGKRSSDSVLVTLTERKTRFGMIFVIPSKESSYVKDLFMKLQRILGDKFNRVFKSVTSDNRSEFSELGKVLNKLGSEGYYTHPYSAYERGTNERMNGLIRRFLPKGKEISKISKEAIKRVRDWYNTLPRRIFNYKSSIGKVFRGNEGNMRSKYIRGAFVGGIGGTI